MTALLSRAVIVPPHGEAIEFAHEGLMLKDWRGFPCDPPGECEP